MDDDIVFLRRENVLDNREQDIILKIFIREDDLILCFASGNIKIDIEMGVNN